MDVQKEREAFEEHITDAGLVEFAGYGFEVDECDEYLHEPTQVAWDSWLIGLRRSKAQAMPEGFVLVHKELPEHIAESMALERVEIPSHESSPIWAKISEDAYKGRLHSKKWELWRDYKEMIQAQEQGHE